MKAQISCFAILGLLSFTSCVNADEEPEASTAILGSIEDGSRVPAMVSSKAEIEQTDSLPLSLQMTRQASGWTLIVYPEGFGSINYGSSADGVAFFPKGVVDFKKLVKSSGDKPVIELKRPEGTQIFDPENVQVPIQTSSAEASEKSGLKALGSEWDAACETILPRLQALRPQRIEQLLEERPLLRKKLLKDGDQEAQPPPVKVAILTELPTPQGGGPPVVPVAVEMVRIQQGWRLTVEADGSGALASGSLVDDWASFPKGTIAFNELVETAKSLPVLEPKEPERRSNVVNVLILGAPRKPTETFELKALGAEWDAICAKILPRLTTPNPQRFRKMLEDDPVWLKKPEQSPEIHLEAIDVGTRSAPPKVENSPEVTRPPRPTVQKGESPVVPPPSR